MKDEVPFDWKVQTSEWSVENSTQWKTEDSDRFFYGIEEKEKTTSELLKEGFEEEKKNE